MNVFQLCMLAAPAAGLFAGARAAAGQSQLIQGLSAGSGLLIGALTYFVPVLSLAFFFEKRAGPQNGVERQYSRQFREWFGNVLVFYAIAAPWICWAVAGSIISHLIALLA